MVISVKDIVRMCKENDVGEVRKLLDDAGLDVEYRCQYTIGSAKIASALLGAAVSMAGLGALSDDIAILLIERIAPRCEIYWLMYYTLLLEGVDSAEETEVIGKCVAFLKKDYSADSHQKAKQMVEETLSAGEILPMIYTLCSGTGEYCLRKGFNDIIIRCLYNKSIVSPAILFAFMASSLMMPEIEDEMNPLDSILGAVFRAYDRRTSWDSGSGNSND